MDILRRLSPAVSGLLLAAALVLRAVVPAGWMPVADPDGIQVEICHGSDSFTVVLGPDGQFRKQSPDNPRDPCPFGLAAGPLLAPQAIPVPEPDASPAGPVYRAIRAFALGAGVALLPPSTGPPAHA